MGPSDIILGMGTNAPRDKGVCVPGNEWSCSCASHECERQGNDTDIMCLLTHDKHIIGHQLSLLRDHCGYYHMTFYMKGKILNG